MAKEVLLSSLRVGAVFHFPKGTKSYKIVKSGNYEIMYYPLPGGTAYKLRPQDGVRVIRGSYVPPRSFRGRVRSFFSSRSKRRR